jgi:hypothetical protein
MRAGRRCLPHRSDSAFPRPLPGLARPDVAAVYNNQNYLYSGYSFLMSGLTLKTACKVR